MTDINTKFYPIAHMIKSHKKTIDFSDFIKSINSLNLSIVFYLSPKISLFALMSKAMTKAIRINWPIMKTVLLSLQV